jgi:hypothetical protein
MFETARNQPILTCEVASPFSARMFGIANGRSVRPIPSSKAPWSFGSGMKVDMMVGATLRCRHATTLPPASTAASIRSTEAVW